MIFDLIFFLGGFLLSVLNYFFSGLSFLIPNAVENSIVYLLGFLNYFGGIINVPALLTTISFLAGFYAIWYSVKIALWLYGFIPYIGVKADIPDAGIQAIAQHRNFQNVMKGRDKISR